LKSVVKTHFEKQCTQGHTKANKSEQVRTLKKFRALHFLSTLAGVCGLIKKDNKQRRSNIGKPT
jgi:hypothetical protein